MPERESVFNNSPFQLIRSFFFSLLDLQHRQQAFFLDVELEVVVHFAELVQLVLLQADPAGHVGIALPCAGQAVDDVRGLVFSDEDRVEHLLLAHAAVVSRVVFPSES